MGSSKRKSFRRSQSIISGSYRQSREPTMQTCPSCNGKRKERVGVGVERLIKCTQCGGKGRIPLKVSG